MSEQEINELIQTGEFAKIDPSAELVNEAVKEPEAPEELLEAAEAHADKQLEDLKDEKNKRKKMLIKFGVMGMLAAIIMVFASIAWFTMNRDVGTSGMSITTTTLPFELKTAGYYGYYDDWITDENVAKIAANRSSATVPPAGESGTLTTGSSAAIQWLVTDESNAKNYVEANTTEENKGIRPGSFGKMTFWVVPKTNETVSVNFKISLEPFKTVYQTSGTGANEVYVYEPGSDTPVELQPVSVAGNADYAEAITYISTHILFFKTRTESNGVYTYSDLITLGEEFTLVYDEDTETYASELTFDKDGDDLLEEELTIYWIWPETLAEAVLPENQQKTGYHAISSGTEVVTKLQSNPGAFLKGYNSSADTNGTADADLTQAVIKTYYSKLSSEYNDADQEIGDNIGYLLLTLEAINN